MNDPTAESVPAWLASRQPEFPATPAVVGVVAVELNALPIQTDLYLTPAETFRFDSMTPRRAAGFLGVRLGCKFLARSLVPRGAEIPDWDRIQTIHDDNGLPVCPARMGTEALACSASHDSRFAFVAVGRRDIGIDVEFVDKRALNGAARFLDSGELDLLPVDTAEAGLVATRLWTIKEAACKLLGIDLLDGWRDVKILRTGPSNSVAHSPRGVLETVHTLVDGHLFTIASMP